MSNHLYAQTAPILANYYAQQYSLASQLYGVYSQSRCSEIAVTMPQASSVDSFGAVSGTVFRPQNNVAEIESGIEIYLDEEETK